MSQLLPGRLGSGAGLSLALLLLSPAAGAADPSFSVGETAMTRLSAEQRRARLLPSYPFPEGYGISSHGAARETDGQRLVWANVNDPYFSWDDVAGACFVTPVRDQGDCGSCFTFGSIAVMETLYRALRGDPSFHIDLSEQEVVSCGAFSSCYGGGTAEEVANYLEDTGVPDEVCFPYTSGNTGDDGECDRACADATPRRHFIAGWGMSYLPWSESTIKEELLNGPVIVNMQVYDDFYGYTGGVYQRSSEVPDGWHIVALVGWDDSDNSWICKNSWGTDWGMQGYFKMSRQDDCDLDIFDLLNSTGVCFASHATTLSVTDAEVYAPVLPDAGSLPDASTARDAAAGRDIIAGQDLTNPRDAGSAQGGDAAQRDALAASAAGDETRGGCDCASGRGAGLVGVLLLLMLLARRRLRAHS